MVSSITAEVITKAVQCITNDDPRIQRTLDKYFGADNLQAWQGLMLDLGYTEHFSSKTQCRKALKSVWVNIIDFLDAVTLNQPVRYFKSRRALVRYTRKHKKFFGKLFIPKGSPLRGLMKCM